MLKKLIAPVQTAMLKKGRCVGCGTALSVGKHSKFKTGEEKVVCACGRIFIYSDADGSYRRALIDEIK